MATKFKLFIIVGLIITGIIISLILSFGLNNSQSQDESDFALSSSSEENNIENTEETETTSENIIIGILLSLLPIIIMVISFKSFFKYLSSKGDRKRILVNGRPARAKIIELGESGSGAVTINNQPFVSLKLEVYDGSSSPYQTEIKTVISRLDIPRFQPGSIIAIKIDPNDKMKIAFDPEKGEIDKDNL